MHAHDLHYRDVIEPALRDERERRAMNKEQLLALGKKMAANPSAIESNMEGYAFRQYMDQLKREAIERDGCCGGKPMADGVCFGIGLCPRVSKHQGAT